MKIEENQKEKDNNINNEGIKLKKKMIKENYNTFI